MKEAPKPTQNIQISEWESLFSALLGKPFTETTLTVSDNKLRIVGLAETVNAIKTVLSSPNEAHRNLKYKLSPVNQESLLESTITLQHPAYPPAPEFSPQAAAAFLYRLVNQATLSLIPEFKADEERQILYFLSTPETTLLDKSDLQTDATLTVKKLRNILQSLTRSQLYHLFNPSLNNAHTKNWYRGDEQLSQENCANIFYTRIDKEGNPIIYLNYAILYGLLFPAPITEITVPHNENVDATIEIEIDKRLLLLQLGELFSAGLIFKVEGEENNTAATPIIFKGMEGHAPKPLWLRVLIDVSSSMQSSLAEYKLRLKEMITQLRAQPDNHDTKIECVPFGNTARPSEIFNLHESAIFTFIDNLTANDNETHLYATVLEQLSNIDKTPDITQNYNIAILLFTDGVDNPHNAQAEKELQIWCQTLPAKKYTPAVFAFGLGKNFSAALMDSLIKTICATFREVKSLSSENFIQVLNLCKHFFEAGKLYEFFKNQGDGVRFMLFPGEVKVLAQSVAMRENFKLNGQNLQLDSVQYEVATAPEIVTQAIQPGHSLIEGPTNGLSMVTMINFLKTIMTGLLTQIQNLSPFPRPRNFTPE